MNLQFSSRGLGEILKPVLERRLATYVGAHHVRHSSTLFGFCDFSGEHKQANFETFSFLFVADVALRNWMTWQANFRQYSGLRRRRMSYKSLNDNFRKRTLSPFLQAAGKLEAVLFNVALPKNAGSIFESSEADEAEQDFCHWKPKTADKAAKIIAFGSYLAASQSHSYQNILVFLDQDSVLGNVEQHTKFAELFGEQVLAHSNHNLGHFRLGSAKSDDGSLVIEDALSIADLAAGAYSDALADMEFPLVDGKISTFFNPSKRLKWKAKKIGAWLTERQKNLEVVNLIFFPKNASGYYAVLLDDELRLRLDLSLANS